MANKKQILAYTIDHGKCRDYFKWKWSMLWVLIKYKLIWGMDISFTVTKGYYTEKYYIEFFAE